MEFFLIVVVVLIAIYLFRRASRVNLENEIKKGIKITVSSSGSISRSGGGFIPEEIIPVDDNGFIINSYSPLPLTIFGCNKEIAKEIKTMLENLTDWNRENELTFLIMKFDIRCKEIDQAIDALRAEFTNSLQEKINLSKEWNDLSDIDCNDALEEYTLDVIDRLTNRPYNVECLRVLMENKEHDYSADNQLITMFSDNAKLYKFYVNKIGRGLEPVKISADDASRKFFDSLVEMGLAVKGKEVPTIDLLSMLKLAELNQLLKSKGEKVFGRKAKAIEFALQLPDIGDLISNNIMLREIFQLKIPEDLAMSELLVCFQYASSYSRILIDTFDTGLRSYSQKHFSTEQSYDYWQIEPGECCNSCKKYHGKRTRRVPTKLPPFHVGCVCNLSGEYENIEAI